MNFGPRRMGVSRIRRRLSLAFHRQPRAGGPRLEVGSRGGILFRAGPAPPSEGRAVGEGSPGASLLRFQVDLERPSSEWA
eukprot:158897-Pyramimonas_sp.AAC.1